MLRTACLTLFSILGCSTLFAQNRPSLEPFDIPGDVVSKPSNLRPLPVRSLPFRLLHRQRSPTHPRAGFKTNKQLPRRRVSQVEKRRGCW